MPRPADRSDSTATEKGVTITGCPGALRPKKGFERLNNLGPLLSRYENRAVYWNETSRYSPAQILFFVVN